MKHWLFNLITATVDSSNVVEWLSEDTFICHNIIKRVWPASQRDALFWTHIRHMQGDTDEEPDLWLVVNYSTNHENIPVRKNCWPFSWLIAYFNKFYLSLVCVVIFFEEKTEGILITTAFALSSSLTVCKNLDVFCDRSVLASTCKAVTFYSWLVWCLNAAYFGIGLSMFRDV